MSDEHAYVEVTMPNIPHLSSEYWEYHDFTVCLNCGKVQGKFPQEEHKFEEVVRKSKNGELDADLYYEDEDEFIEENENLYGVDGLKYYLKKTPNEYVYHIEEKDGVGFAQINNKKDYEKNGGYTNNNYCYFDDDIRSLKQVDKSLFCMLVNRKPKNITDLKSELDKLGFENIQQNESIFE